jgi:DNA-binding MarR family transcriptional regulator
MSKKKKSDVSDLSRLLSIDKIIHEPARFMILAYLSAVESADFIFLLNQTGLTQGNLSFHLSKLEESEYVAIEKKFIGKRPHTLLSITDKGSKALKEHLKVMKELIDSLFSAN